jgi:hypothetical protein
MPSLSSWRRKGAGCPTSREGYRMFTEMTPLTGAMCTDGWRSLKKGKPGLKTSHVVGDHQLRPLTRTLSVWINWFAWKESHTPWARYTTGLWSQCCEEVGTTMHTWISSERFQEFVSTMAKRHRLWWRLTSVWRKSYSTNMCNFNDLCQLIKKLWSFLHFFRYAHRIYVLSD